MTEMTCAAQSYPISDVKPQLGMCGIWLYVVGVHAPLRSVSAPLAGVVVSSLDGRRPLALITRVVTTLTGHAALPVVMVGAAKRQLWFPALRSNRPLDPLRRLYNALSYLRQESARFRREFSALARLRIAPLGLIGVLMVPDYESYRLAGDVSPFRVALIGEKGRLTTPTFANAGPSYRPMPSLLACGYLGARLGGVLFWQDSILPRVVAA
jgi:hypothetical protein